MSKDKEYTTPTQHSTAKQEREERTLTLHEFDPIIKCDPEMKPDATIGIFGARRTGKSYLTRMLLWMMRAYFPFVYVITESKMNKWYEQFLPPDCIIEGYDIEFLEMILEEQKQKVEAWRSGKSPDNPMICIVWDDCLPAKMQWDHVFIEIYFYGRHYKVFNIMLSQYFYRIPKSYRQNIDYIFSLKQDALVQLDGFWEDILGRRVNRDEFISKFDEATNDNGFVCFVVCNKDRPITDNVYFGKAFDPGPFILGCEQMWNTLDGRKHLENIYNGKAREAAEKEIEIENEQYFKEIEAINRETWLKKGNPPIEPTQDIIKQHNSKNKKLLEFPAEKNIEDPEE